MQFALILLKVIKMKKIIFFLLCYSVNSFAMPVDVNRADAKTIADSLTGVDFKQAQAIVANRMQKGLFKNRDDFIKRLSTENQTMTQISLEIIELNKTDIVVSEDKTARQFNVRHGRTRQRHGHTHERYYLK